MRLIDDTATKIDVWELFNGTYNDASRFTEEETEFTKRILSDVQEVIEKQPTAFDLEGAIERLKKLTEKAEKTMNNAMDNSSNYPCEYNLADLEEQKYKTLCEVLEILKSTANATNGKNGG